MSASRPSLYASSLVFAPLTFLLAMLFWRPVAAESPSALTSHNARPETSLRAASLIEAPRVRGDARRAVSANFSVRSEDTSHPADRIARECERQRQHLQQRWLGQTDTRWSPRCEVVIHANENAYLRHLGPRAAMTRGVSTIDRQPGRTVSRNINLMADPLSGDLTALAHELTHLVVADRFVTRQPPRWADEGIALLADDAVKKQLHLRDLRHGLDNHCCPGLPEALAMRHYPKGARLTAFYGQSLSLVSYLTELDDPAKVVDMVAIAMERGYDAALHEIYGIADTAELERRWRRHLSDPSRLVAR